MTSIDRVHRCADEWGAFARIALNHVLGDIICGGAEPIQAMISYEFGVDASAEDRAKCSDAFAEELERRGIALGKCHSALNDGVSAVTIAVLGRNNKVRRRNLSQGSIFLSRPLGAFKLHYLKQLGREISFPNPQQILEFEDHRTFLQKPWDMVTDVSGHGLLGAADSVGKAHKLALHLQFSKEIALSPEVMSEAVDCLENPVDSYGIPIECENEEALSIAMLRETAGPMLGFMETQHLSACDLTGFVKVGEYGAGAPGTKLSWLG